MSGDRSTTPEAAKVAVDRLTFFSDAVVAIAMTLLAIDLPVPEGDSREAVFGFLGEHVAEYSAFFISFFVISQYWRGHHRLFRYVTDAPPTLVSTNAVWLLTVVLTPFATRVLWAGHGSENSDFPYRFGLYALVQAVAALTFLRSTALIGADLLIEGTPRSVLTRSRARSLALAGTFLVSIPLAVLVGPWAFFGWGALPIVMAITLRFTAREETLEAET